ncbi:unnamed protein product [Vitrella brassicaformis CCMP3155]|uniref:Peroxisomal membrane protein 2 n=1 Tax=Vitrella brassicaformis (strain CCMP3155) TaxID=1169540 RepID=A0A0G4G6P1_VITBC|nr:unnamed protein product [Vitrella brassicaformis CCMP3155]|mmetsp:Transcript_2163/g.5836  ORF Transcript_2163/g.5836 Transcript_2163/m.5836 type:complete len:440 (+) Transcript_2163:145-1464(+)|eukprot:CEM24033.1 unnamed protein product [Vitrella brassicaformis CCMP3155]
MALFPLVLLLHGASTASAFTPGLVQPLTRTNTLWRRRGSKPAMAMSEGPLEEPRKPAAEEPHIPTIEEVEHAVEEELRPVVRTVKESVTKVVMSAMDEGVSSLAQTRTAQTQNVAVLAAVAAYIFLQFSTVDSDIWRGWSFEEVLYRLPLANWNAYEAALAREPILTKSVLTGATYFIGDWIAQWVENTDAGRDPLLVDRWRILRNTLLGFVVLGPLAHFYYDWNGDWPLPWPVKLLFDQLAYVPFYNTVYFVLLEAMNGKTFKQAWDDYAKKWWTLLKAGLKLWPLVGILTYTIVPVRHRLLWVDSIEIIYAAILSSIANAPKDPNHTLLEEVVEEAAAHEHEHEEQQPPPAQPSEQQPDSRQQQPAAAPLTRGFGDVVDVSDTPASVIAGGRRGGPPVAAAAAGQEGGKDTHTHHGVREDAGAAREGKREGNELTLT